MPARTLSPASPPADRRAAPPAATESHTPMPSSQPDCCAIHPRAPLPGVSRRLRYTTRILPRCRHFSVLAGDFPARQPRVITLVRQRKYRHTACGTTAGNGDCRCHQARIQTAGEPRKTRHTDDKARDARPAIARRGPMSPQHRNRSCRFPAQKTGRLQAPHPDAYNTLIISSSCCSSAVYCASPPLSGLALSVSTLPRSFSIFC